MSKHESQRIKKAAIQSDDLDRFCPRAKGSARGAGPSRSEANRPGFDRAAFLRQLAIEVAAFFDKNLL